MEDTTSLFNYRDPRSLMADSYASQYQPLSGTPQQMIIQTGANAGSLLGNALFGGKTSAMAEQAVLNEAIKESEVAQDPDERLKLFAAALRKRGLEGYAQKAESQLLARQKTLSDINKNKADAEMKQVAYANRYAALASQFPEMKPEVALGLALDEVAFREFFKDKQIKYSNTVEEISKELYEKPFSQLTSKEAEAVNLLKEQREGDKASKGASRVSVGVPDIAGILQEIGAKEDAKVKAANWDKAGEAYKAQVPMLAQLDEVTQLLPRTFTGSFANTSLQFGKALSGLGIPIDEAKLTNTEYLNAVSAQLLQTIARNFPGALAVKEMDQLIKSKPNSQQQVTTIVKILDGLKTEMKANILAYEALAKLPDSERYGKNFNIVQAEFFRKLKRYESLVAKANKAKSDATGKSGLTKEEVAEAQRLQQELGEK